MRLLITSSKNFLSLDTSSGKIDSIHSGMGLYYGITYSESEIFVAARNNYDPFNYLAERSTETGYILVFNYKLEFLRQIQAPFRLADLHQIMYFDDKLWLTCSFDNRVVIYDFNQKSWQKWYPAQQKIFSYTDKVSLWSKLSLFLFPQKNESPEKDEGNDINHFNSFWFYQGELYLLAHNLGASDIYIFSYPKLNYIKKIALGHQAHNIWGNEDELFVCDSANGQVISTNGFKKEIGGFPRGVIIKDDLYIIGSSSIAERSNRHSVTSYVYVFDQQWQKLQTFELSGYGQVLDIMAPDYIPV